MLIIKYGIKIKRFVSANKDIHFINQLKTVLSANHIKSGMFKPISASVLLKRIYVKNWNHAALIKFGIYNKLNVYVKPIFIKMLIICVFNVEKIKFGIVNRLLVNVNNNFKKLMKIA